MSGHRAEWEPNERALRRLLAEARAQRDLAERERDDLRELNFLIGKPHWLQWVEKCGDG